MKRFGIAALLLFLLISAVLCAGIVWFSATDYQGTAVLSAEVQDNAPLDVRASDAVIAVTEAYVRDGVLHYTVEPVQSGSATLTVSLQESGKILLHGDFYALPFGRILADVEAPDFNGSFAVNIIVFLDLLAVTVFMWAAFFRRLRCAQFGYDMIISGGTAVFLLIFVVFLLFSWLLPAQRSADAAPSCLTFGSFLSATAASAAMLAMVTAPFLAVMSVAAILGNLLLIRREGFRLVHLLGIVLGLLWFAGMIFLLLRGNRPHGRSDREVYGAAIVNTLSVVASYGVCLLAATLAAVLLAASRKPPYDRDYLVIPGCALRRDGSLTPLLKGRVDAAVAFERAQFANTGKHAVYVPTGGRGDGESLPQSEAMRRYLTENGVPDEQILTEDAAVSTFQSLMYAGDVIEKHGGKDKNLAFATADYQIFRCFVLAERVPLRHVGGISAKTKWYFYPNAVLRELTGLASEEMNKLSLLVVLLAAAEFFATLAAFL